MSTTFTDKKEYVHECRERLKKYNDTRDPMKIYCMYCPALEECPHMWGPYITAEEKALLVKAFKTHDPIEINKALIEYEKRRQGVR